jgi:hypothetical protein
LFEMHQQLPLQAASSLTAQNWLALDNVMFVVEFHTYVCSKLRMSTQLTTSSQVFKQYLKYEI